MEMNEGQVPLFYPSFLFSGLFRRVFEKTKKTAQRNDLDVSPELS